MAEKYGLGVLVDLHGAPGAQNDQAHSGVSTGQQNLFNNPTNIQLTLNVLTYLTQQLVKVNNVVGIEILNEPSNVDSLPSFYNQMLTTLRQVSPEAAAFPFYIHDAFDMPRFADYISTRKDFVVLDHHSYFVFDSASQSTPASKLADAFQPGHGSVSQQVSAASSEVRRNIMVGEWSCALSGDALKDSADPAGDRRKFCSGQMESYTNATAGWAFWSYKTENCDSDPNWCFTGAVGNSLPSTFHSYPNSSVKAIFEKGLEAFSESSNSGTAGLPEDSSFLTFGTAMPLEDSISPESADKWLAAMGKSNTDYRYLTEALATTEFEEAPTSGGQMRPSDGSDSKNKADTDDSYKNGNAQQAAFVNTATIPSSRLEAIGHRKRSFDLPQRAFLLASELRQHRFAARHARAHSKRDETAIGFTPEQAAIAKGYADGWRAAKTFASFNSSRLGFTGQFIVDALAAMDQKIVSGDEQYYREWFSECQYLLKSATSADPMQ